MFLGTPHRGSHLAELAETARRIVSAVGMDTNSRILDSLGLRTSELDRVQTSFSNVWHTYGFRVKTFQEGLGFMPTSIINMNKKVIPVARMTDEHF
jgi:protein SERAC1